MQALPRPPPLTIPFDGTVGCPLPNPCGRDLDFMSPMHLSSASPFHMQPNMPCVPPPTSADLYSYRGPCSFLLGSSSRGSPPSPASSTPPTWKA